MGGGGALNPISVISGLVFGSQLANMASDGPSAAQSAQAEADAAAAEAQAEARRRADRKKAEAAMLAQARKAERASLAGQDEAAESLGAPSVAASSLKARLGQ